MALQELVAARVHPATAVALQELSFETGKSLSELIREAVERFLSDASETTNKEDNE